MASWDDFIIENLIFFLCGAIVFTALIIFLVVWIKKRRRNIPRGSGDSYYEYDQKGNRWSGGRATEKERNIVSSRKSSIKENSERKSISRVDEAPRTARSQGGNSPAKNSGLSPELGLRSVDQDQSTPSNKINATEAVTISPPYIEAGANSKVPSVLHLSQQLKTARASTYVDSESQGTGTVFMSIKSKPDESELNSSDFHTAKQISDTSSRQEITRFGRSKENAGYDDTKSMFTARDDDSKVFGNISKILPTNIQEDQEEEDRNAVTTKPFGQVLEDDTKTNLTDPIRTGFVSPMHHPKNAPDHIQ